MSSEKVWFSNVINKLDNRLMDYNLSVEGKVDSHLLLQYKHILSDEEIKKIESEIKINASNYADLAQKFKGKKN